MTTKQYLSQIRTLTIRMQKLSDKMNKFRDGAFGMRGVDYSADRVQGSASGGMPAVENYVDRTQEMQKQYNRMAYRRRIIISQIDHLGEPQHTQLLGMRYVQFYNWDKIARHLSLSKRQVYRIHNDALAQFEQKYLHKH